MRVARSCEKFFLPFAPIMSPSDEEKIYDENDDTDYDAMCERNASKKARRKDEARARFVQSLQGGEKRGGSEDVSEVGKGKKRKLNDGGSEKGSVQGDAPVKREARAKGVVAEKGKAKEVVKIEKDFFANTEEVDDDEACDNCRKSKIHACRIDLGVLVDHREARRDGEPLPSARGCATCVSRKIACSFLGPGGTKGKGKTNARAVVAASKVVVPKRTESSKSTPEFQEGRMTRSQREMPEVRVPNPPWNGISEIVRLRQHMDQRLDRIEGKIRSLAVDVRSGRLHDETVEELLRRIVSNSGEGVPFLNDRFADTGSHFSPTASTTSESGKEEGQEVVIESAVGGEVDVEVGGEVKSEVRKEDQGGEGAAKEGEGPMEE